MEEAHRRHPTKAPAAAAVVPGHASAAANP
jgi:hypothetical protein